VRKKARELLHEPHHRREENQRKNNRKGRGEQRRRVDERGGVNKGKPMRLTWEVRGGNSQRGREFAGEGEETRDKHNEHVLMVGVNSNLCGAKEKELGEGGRGVEGGKTGGERAILSKNEEKMVAKVTLLVHSLRPCLRGAGKESGRGEH